MKYSLLELHTLRNLFLDDLKKQSSEYKEYTDNEIMFLVKAADTHTNLFLQYIEKHSK